MTINLSTTIRSNRLDQIEATIGTLAVLKIRTGTKPATCATADSGTVLATMTLPSDWMNAASGGSKTLLGTWSDTSADTAGNAGHFRLYESTGVTCHLQGSITVTSGGGDMEIDNTVISTGQEISVTAFTLTDGNA